MVGYYDFSTKKYYNSPPKKDERCHGFWIPFVSKHI
jgi:hypothetical protein